MKIYESPFLLLEFFEEHKLIEMTWLSETKNMTNEQYKEEFLKYLDIILELRPNKIITDATETQFVASIELQEWTNQTIFVPSLEIGLNKAAFVVTKEIIIQVSIEQVMEEEEGAKFTTKYFY